MTPQEQLLATADYIEEHGWTHCGMFEWKGRYCVLGAFNRATSYGVNKNPALTLLCNYVNVPNIQSLVVWNDSRTHRNQVLKALRAAAKLDMIE